MDEIQWHHFVLLVAGISGVLCFFGAGPVSQLWSKPKRVLLGIGFGGFYVSQLVSAFTNLSGASSLEVFAFIGGSFGAARIMGR